MIETVLTDHHHALRDAVRTWAQAHVAPRVAALETSQEIETDLVRDAARRGWIGVTIPASYGGMGAGQVAKLLIIEEIARVSGAVAAAVQASQLGTAKLLHFGSQEQKTRWLPRIAAGDCLPTIAVTEPGSGGHVLGMQATAVRDGDEYVLNGRKVFVGNSHIGDVHGVVARTGPGSDGLLALLVEAGTPGLRLGDLRTSIGLRGFSFGELIFENCRVPVAHRVGGVGDGLAVAYSSSVLYGRLQLTGVALGIHRAVLDATCRYVTNQQRYGKPLSALPTVQLTLGRMQARLLTSETLAYQAAHLLDRGRPGDAAAMTAKAVGTESAITSARDAIDVLGAEGLHTDAGIERHLRDSLSLIAPAGTTDIQHLRLAQTALGTAHPDWSHGLAHRLTASVSAPWKPWRTPNDLSKEEEPPGLRAATEAGRGSATAVQTVTDHIRARISDRTYPPGILVSRGLVAEDLSKPGDRVTRDQVGIAFADLAAEGILTLTGPGRAQIQASDTVPCRATEIADYIVKLCDGGALLPGEPIPPRQELRHMLASDGYDTKGAIQRLIDAGTLTAVPGRRPEVARTPTTTLPSWGAITEALRHHGAETASHEEARHAAAHAFRWWRQRVYPSPATVHGTRDILVSAASHLIPLVAAGNPQKHPAALAGRRTAVAALTNWPEDLTSQLWRLALLGRAVNTLRDLTPASAAEIQPRPLP